MNQDQNLSLTGEVVEIYEKDGLKVAKILFNPGFVEIPLNNLPDVHLNDKIIINSAITIESILSNSNENESFI